MRDGLVASREEAKKLLEQDATLADRLICGRIFFNNFLTDEPETLVIFSPSGHQVRKWLEDRIATCKKHGSAYCVYFNYGFDTSEGNLTFPEDN